MNWIWIILVVAVIFGIIGYFSSDEDKMQNALAGAVSGGLGCGYVILQIFFAILGIALLFWIGSWLFS